MIYWNEADRKLTPPAPIRENVHTTNVEGILGPVFVDLLALRLALRTSNGDELKILQRLEEALFTAYCSLEDSERFDTKRISSAVDAANAALEPEADQNLHQISNPDVRAKVWALTQGRCAYCDGEVMRDAEDRMQSFCVEHVVPRSSGGPDNIANYVPACMSCNSSKGDRHVLTLIRRMQKRHLSVVVDNPEREVIETAEGGAA